MIFYVLYATATGEITAWGGTLDLSSVLVPQGYALLETPTLTTSLTHYVAGGALVAHPPEQVLATSRAQAWERIKRAREAFWDAPLQTPFGTFDHGPKARSDIAGAVQLLQLQASRGLPSAVDYTLADNSTRTLTLAQMEVVGLLAGKRINDGFATGRTLRTQIDAAPTLAEVGAIAWNDPPPG